MYRTSPVSWVTLVTMLGAINVTLSLVPIVIVPRIPFRIPVSIHNAIHGRYLCESTVWGNGSGCVQYRPVQ